MTQWHVLCPHNHLVKLQLLPATSASCPHYRLLHMRVFVPADKTLVDSERRAVPLRQLSFLLTTACMAYNSGVNLPVQAGPKTVHFWCTTSMWHFKKKMKLEMWANGQRHGRPAEYRWRPLFSASVSFTGLLRRYINAVLFGWRPLLEYRAVTLPRRETR